ncbi:MAG TPA: radical SAM family heme chaperone HemW [Gemmatimonadaceae bacterium]|nr:radical SAM family heme chaperone HemW [Gemmatimonadaceae bacterium]
MPRHLYIHVPFCARRCAYCDFAIAVRRVVPVAEYVDAVARELAMRAPDDAPWEVDTLYLGGGTPSMLGADGVARLLDRVRERVRISPGAEVTLEANPENITPESVRAWRAAGVGRLSIGAQSFDDRVLAWMHRTHDAERIVRAVEHARGEGIEDLSLDLIFALPESLERDWERDVRTALSLEPTHISLYGLTIEPDTPLGRWRDRGAVTEAPEERYERDFLLAHDLLGAAGYDHYEVSNYGRAGHRARHNSSYWRHVPYMGVGPAAHSFDGASRRWNIAAYAEWARAVAAGRDPSAGAEVLTGEERAAERVYLGLRTIDGLDLDDAMARRVLPWLDTGWATLSGTRLRLTATGWLRLDALAADLTLVGSR